MMWSMRTPPACRSTARISARNGSVLLLFQPVRPPRRLRPVLAELIELVRRRARGHAQRQHVLQGPGVGAVRMHADGQVVHDADRHSGPDRLRLRRGELLVELPLQPAVEVDGVGMLFGETAHHRHRRGAAANSARRASRRRTSRPARTRSRSRRAHGLHARGRRRRPARGQPIAAPRATASSAARLAAQALSRSIASRRPARCWTSDRNRRTRPRLVRSANSGTASTRR